MCQIEGRGRKQRLRLRIGLARLAARLPKERCLKPKAPLRIIVCPKVPRDIPPLDLEIRMGAVIARKGEKLTRPWVGELW